MGRFAEIQFGYSSAETESMEEPGLLLDGFVDMQGAFNQARTGPKFLFLGYKGAGKSAIGERIRLSAIDSPLDFVTQFYLQDFPFTPFSKMIRGDAEPESKYPDAWSWILLIYTIASLAKDEGMRHPDHGAIRSALDAFGEMGLSPNANVAELVRKTAKTSFKLSVPKIYEQSWSSREVRPASEIPDFVSALKDLASKARTDSRHYIIIDGLDDILTSRDVQYKSLGALIFECSRLNQFFKQNHVPMKIIILCRTDLFERISGANKNKIRQDFAIELDWYHDPHKPGESQLFQIADMRIKRSLGAGYKLTDFIPDHVNGSNSLTYLLDMTRHTPRDFIQLLSQIQKLSHGDKLSNAEITSGMRQYSIKYFLPEIKDELSGYAAPDEIDNIFSIFSRVKKRDLSLKDIYVAAGMFGIKLDQKRIEALLTHLFECSAIGNIKKKPGGTTFYTFNYRNRHSSFDPMEGIMLHKGLWKALNLM
ncbi:P-loop ATPase, Sll1717 family [Phreatobacter sp. HK31-P]